MDTLSPQQFISDLQNNLRSRYPVHPLRKLLLTGWLSKEQLQGLAKNQFHELRKIHRTFGIRYQKWPNSELRRALLENMSLSVSPNVILEIELSRGKTV
jgi:pyrroloquinoline quinone (PQQ) biosynthesis protein C